MIAHALLQSLNASNARLVKTYMAEALLNKKDVLGNWRLEKQLAEGGQGVVWRARYNADEHSPAAAIKICLSRSEKARARFIREVELLRAQNHPGIVRVRDAGEAKGLPYFVMELANTTLAQIAGADSPGTRLILESRELLFRFVRQACEGVSYLHEHGVLHRDIKPSNILLMLDPPEPMRAVVADLGIGANEGEQGKLTATHEMIGTPAFRAPESFSGQHTARSDVYSLGKTIEAVFNRGAPVEIGPGKCLRDEKLTSELWDALDAVFVRACAFDPAHRFPTARALLEALPETVLGHTSSRVQLTQGQRPAAITLSIAERVALSEVIAECPSSDESASVQAVRRKTHLNEYHLAISLRRLEGIGFLHASREEDEHGNRYTLVQPTKDAVLWAHTHHEEVLAAIAEVAPKLSKDDDIPF